MIGGTHIRTTGSWMLEGGKFHEFERRLEILMQATQLYIDGVFKGFASEGKSAALNRVTEAAFASVSADQAAGRFA
jgi:hypothetical protein